MKVTARGRSGLPAMIDLTTDVFAFFCRPTSGHQSLMCITSPDPLDILLRKQPPPATASFFLKSLFLIEEGSVQSYAQKEAYSEK